jgi:hypothetical protein
MAIETAVKIDVDVNGIQTVQQAATVYEDLGDAVAKTQREAEALAFQFGINDDRTKEAIRRAGEYKGQLELLDQAIDGSKGGTDQLFRAVQGVAAGFEIAAGAAAIFGTTSEDLEKILIRVQAAMVFSQGLRDLKEFAPAILNIAKATRTWFVSLSLIQKAFLTLGIGLVIDLVYNLATAFDSVAEKTNLATKEQIAYNEQIQKLKQEQRLIIEGERVVVEENLRNTKARLKAGQDALKEQVANDNAYFESLRKLGIDVRDSEIKRRTDNINAQKLQNEELYLEQLKLTKRLEELKAQETKTNTKATKESVEEEKQTKSDFEEWTKKQREQSAKDLATFQGKQLQSTTGALQAQAAANIAATNVVIEQTTDNQLSNIERLKLGVSAFGLDFVNTFVNTFAAISELTTAFANESEASQRKAFQVRKALSLTTATIATVEATLEAFKSASASPITTVFPAYPFVQAATAAAFGIAKIATISRQQFNPNLTPSPSVGPVSTAQTFTAPTTRLPQGQDILTQERRVFVLEGDITRTQRRAATNQNVSVLGG